MKQITQSELSTQEDAVIYFMQRLDYDMVDDILDEDRTYQDLSKPLFINKLSLALEVLAESGDTYLDAYRGFCNSEECNYKCKGVSFVGNCSKKYIDLIIEKDSTGKVLDLYECRHFECSEGNPEKTERVRIVKIDIDKLLNT